MDYELLTEASVAHYLGQYDPEVLPIELESIHVREVGDGNLNLVFVCEDDAGGGLVLKQALPYVRVAPDWPMTPDRARHEAIGLREARAASPETSPEIYFYDHEDHVVGMELLRDSRVWRDALIDGQTHPGIGEWCGRHVARLSVATGPFGRSGPDVRDAASWASNPALCEITENLVFTEPFIDHEHNVHHDELIPAVSRIAGDPAVRLEVSRLKFEFLTRGEGLIHGDLHTGSVMVPAEPADTGSRPPRVFDTEFGFYGPVAFDLGVLIANMLLAHRRAVVLERREQARWLQHQPVEIWEGFSEELESLWVHVPSTVVDDAYRATWLARVRRDLVGFAGCEAIRRIVGFAKVADIESLDEADHVAAASSVLETAHSWLLDPEQPLDLLV